MLGNLREKLSRTRQAFKKFEELFQSGKRREEVLDDLAEAMILADVGVSTTEKIIEAIRVRTNKDDSPSALKEALRRSFRSSSRRNRERSSRDQDPRSS